MVVESGIISAGVIRSKVEPRDRRQVHFRHRVTWGRGRFVLQASNQGGVYLVKGSESRVEVKDGTKQETGTAKDQTVYAASKERRRGGLGEKRRPRGGEGGSVIRRKDQN